jgi:hypothetical protein
LPAPVRKAVAKAKRPSSDHNTRAKQLMAEHMAKVEATQAPWLGGMVPPVTPFAEQLSAHMRALGAKGGKVSGAKRMEMPTRSAHTRLRNAPLMFLIRCGRCAGA